VSSSDSSVAEVWDDWQDAVNMTAKQLGDWLATDEPEPGGPAGEGR
jgi:hypothetical protein